MLTRLTIALLLVCSYAPAQPAAPSTARVRKPLIVPSNFKIVIVDRRRAVCQEGDEAWVRQALADAKPATMPTTMPSTLLEKLSEQRDVLAERVAADVGLPDPAEPKKMLDENLLPLLRQAAAFDPPVYYMVSTEPAVRQLIKAGWENPLFYLNRAADRVAINVRVDMSMAGDMDDTLLPALYEPAHDMATRRRILLDSIAQAEQRLAYELAIQSEYAVQMSFVGFVGQRIFKPLELTDNQEWFAIGVTAVLSAKYLAVVNGMNEVSYLERMMTDDPRNPIRMSTVDLVNPLTSEQLRSNYQRPYLDAYRRRATAVAHGWLARIPPGALGKTLSAIKTSKPADGPALVKLIADQTGIDLTEDLKPR